MNLVKFFTKRIRCNKAKKFIKDEEDKNLLDIGCGDGFFIKTFKDLNADGVDKIQGIDVEEGLNYENNSFDYITILAVIEHLNHPKRVMHECHRLLKNNGLLIITTPFKKAENLIRLYNFKDLGHKRYFTKKNFENLKGFDLIHYSTFELGLNQLVVLKKQTIIP